VGDPCHPLAARAHAPAICFNARQNPDITGDISDCLGAQDRGHAVLADTAIRRLTPRECERLQGFPDDHTLVPYRGKLAADGPRYAAIGNSMAVPVIRWIGERIAAADAEP
jgi:DNA (cytosine-5)-methyltransferase 1